jgi:hypothetical protein
MSKIKNHDKVLTLQVHHEDLNPRTFKFPIAWMNRAAIFAWILLSVAVISSIYSVKEYFSERLARPELVKELENEVQELKIALEKKGTPVAPIAIVQNSLPAGSIKADPNASDEKPPAAAGEVMPSKEGVWSGLAENISLPAPGTLAPVKLEDPRVDWQGKYANFTVNVLYRDPGKGSQQGHIVVLARANDRIFAHPEGVLNTAEGNYLFSPDRGEYYSVARFRVLKTRLGPFENPKQLSEVQVFLFDLNNKLIVVQNFPYANK